MTCPKRRKKRWAAQNTPYNKAILQPKGEADFPKEHAHKQKPRDFFAVKPALEKRWKELLTLM